MFTVYTEKETFEEILIFNDEYPNWNAILLNHAEVCINLDKDNYDAESLNIDSIIFHYIHLTGGRELFPLSVFFKALYDDPMLVVNNPRSVFFLDLIEAEAKAIQRKTGNIVFGKEMINDMILSGTFFKFLEKNAIYENQGKLGWKLLLHDLPPLNAVIITDNFLFHNEDGIRGTRNLLNILESILPEDLETEFHICLLAQEPPERNNAWCKRKVEEIKLQIEKLGKSYPVKFELIFSETIHNRMVISNYFVVAMDKGFAVFSSADNKTVYDNNDFRFNRVFSSVDPAHGDTVFSFAHKKLCEIKRKCDSLKEYNKNRDGDKNKKILGDCCGDKSIVNRLIRDV